MLAHLPLLLFSLLGSSRASPAGRAPSLLAPLYVPPVASHDLINNSYIVIFREDIHPSVFTAHLGFIDYAKDVHPLHGRDDAGGVTRVYDSLVAKGYAGTFSDGVVEMIRSRPEVKYIELNQVVRPDKVQKDPTWGLARLNHRDQIYKNNMHYVYDYMAGYGAVVYVIDTGVQVEHEEFGGRAAWGTTYYPDEGFKDGRGHGTHVAGTIGATKYGVAKYAQIRAVKVFDKKHPGDTSIVIAGVQWAVNDAVRYAQQHPNFFKGAVINMSLGGGRSRAEEDAVNNAVRAGAHVIVSAGNDNKDACDQSPAAAKLVITVGASSITDTKADFSNWGRCVDVHAPGTGIISTWIGSTSATNVLQGTSMSAPHVSGLVAYFISIYPHWSFNPSSYLKGEGVSSSESRPLVPKTTGLTPESMKKALLYLSSRGKISGLPSGTPNLLIYNNMTHQNIIPDQTEDALLDQWSQDA